MTQIDPKKLPKSVEGYVDPHFSFIFNPFGFTPMEITFAPRSFNNLGAAL